MPDALTNERQNGRPGQGLGQVDLLAGRIGRKDQGRNFFVFADAVLGVRLGHQKTAMLWDFVEQDAVLDFDHIRERPRFQVFATLLFAWLSRVSDAGELALGAPYHNRSSAKFRQTAGLFMELFPVHVSIEPEETFSSLARKVSAATHQLLLHAHPGASASPDARRFAVVLNYVTASFGEFAGLPVQSDWVHAGFGDPQHCLRLQVYDFDRKGEFALDFDLSADVFGDLEAGWAIRHFTRLADALIADPEQRIDTIALVENDDLPEFAPDPPAPGAAGDLIKRFEAEVVRRPDSVAIKQAGDTLRYADLDARANALAARLIQMGVEVGDAVGLCLTTSADSIQGRVVFENRGLGHLGDGVVNPVVSASSTSIATAMLSSRR